MHTVTLGKIVARWFLRQRSRAMALATFGASLGGTILVPLNAMLLHHWGSLAGGLALALIAAVMIIPLALWVVKDRPEVLGLEVDGDTTSGAKAEEPLSAAAVADAYPWTVPEAMRTIAFWATAVCFSVGMIAQSGFLVHQVMFLQTTFSLVGAAGVVTVTTMTGTLGRVLFAIVGNRWVPRHVAAVIFLLQALGLALSALGEAKGVLIVGSALFGFTMGVIVILQPLITAQCFGQQAFGRIYGPIYLGIRLGAASGPLLFGVLATAMDHYRPVLLLVAAGLVLASFGVRWAVPPGRCRDGGRHDRTGPCHGGAERLPAANKQR